jgi:hypothetical protein
MATASRSNGTGALAIVSGVAFALVLQIIFALIGIGVGILVAPPATAGTFAAGFVWWLLSGIIASAAAGYVVGVVSDETDGTRVGMLALTAWAIAAVLVTIAAGFSSAGGFLSMLGGPASDLMAQVRSASGADFARKTLAVAALASAAALALGAAAATFTAVETRTTLYMSYFRSR